MPRFVLTGSAPSGGILNCRTSLLISDALKYSVIISYQENCQDLRRPSPSLLLILNTDSMKQLLNL